MPRPRPPEQLDIPLVWELEPAPPPPAGSDDMFPARAPREGCGAVRLLLAALADLGVALAALALALVTAVVAGASMRPEQLWFAAVVGIELAAVLGIACVWGWRATPGQLLVRVALDEPVTLGRSTVFWLVWIVVSPLLASPLLLGRRGNRPAERLAGSPFSCR